MLKPVRREDAPVEAAAALARLREGNHRFVNELTSMRSRLTSTREWRAHLAEAQFPFASVVACSDSRVPAEIVFDQGLGDLFIVRNAGAVLGHAPLASIEFAVAKLRTRLVVVLAHERCGAIQAALGAAAGDAPSTESLRELIARLSPAIAEAGTEGTEVERCERAAHIHVRRTAEQIAQSPVLGPLVGDGTVLVVPAYYRLAEGTVEWGEPVAPARALAAARERAASPATAIA
jgi:carbonic anhydrase